MSTKINPPTGLVTFKWSLSPTSWIKINMDAALDNSSSFLAAVARDGKCDVIKVWAKTRISCSSLQVEANAIL